MGGCTTLLPLVKILNPCFRHFFKTGDQSFTALCYFCVVSIHTRCKNVVRRHLCNRVAPAVLCYKNFPCRGRRGYVKTKILVEMNDDHNHTSIRRTRSNLIQTLVPASVRYMSRIYVILSSVGSIRKHE